MTSLPESRIETKSWSLWAGTAGDLERLFKSMQKQYAPLIPAHVEKELRHPRKMLQFEEENRERLRKNAEEYGTDAGLAARITKSEAELRKLTEELEKAETEALAAGSIQLSLSGLNGDRTTVTGNATQLIEYLDGKRFKSFVAIAPSGDIRAKSITVGGDREDGVDLRVSSNDAVWCRAAFSEVAEEIKKGVPRWKFIRRNWALWIFFNLINWGIWFLSAALLPKGQLDLTGGIVYTVAFGVIVGAMLVGGMIWSRRYVPAFEIVPTGGQPRGVTFMKFWGYTVGVGLLLGVVGNGISKLVFGDG
ncbi:hypothetical protein ACIPY3_04475 [Paenarthrobacter sp. NPDC089714]|uniref:hypothetical protein n=1 Tax=Paenarthrobacter sp. NPDC089714 TaxID=3364377 RepID=UPI00382FD7E3